VDLIANPDRASQRAPCPLRCLPSALAILWHRIELAMESDRPESQRKLFKGCLTPSRQNGESRPSYTLPTNPSTCLLMRRESSTTPPQGNGLLYHLPQRSTSDAVKYKSSRRAKPHSRSSTQLSWTGSERNTMPARRLRTKVDELRLRFR